MPAFQVSNKGQMAVTFLLDDALGAQAEFLDLTPERVRLRTVRLNADQGFTAEGFTSRSGPWSSAKLLVFST